MYPVKYVVRRLSIVMRGICATSLLLLVGTPVSNCLESEDSNRKISAVEVSAGVVAKSFDILGAC
jgi:hypothetical protein